jgi:hypothetical protein
LGTGVSEYSSLNHNLTESRTLPDLAITPTSEILNAAILLNEVFPNFELTEKEKLEINQNG